MTGPDTPQPENPFVGPRPLEIGDSIYGRDREIRELRDLLIARRIVVLYSPSGAGKTSLIQAGLIPELERADFHVLPIIRVNQPLDPEVAGSANRYVLSTLYSLDGALPENERMDASALATMDLRTYLARWPNTTDPDLSDALIFDQFEEILTLDPTDQEAKSAFFAQVGDALRDGDRWALFVLREDHLAALDPYLPAIPTRLATSFRIDLLGPDAARDAMQKPALAAGVGFADDAVARLVDDLRRVRVQQPDGSMEERLGPFIEPVHLQVVCQRLLTNLPSDRRIDTELVAAHGDVDGSLRAFYATSVAAVAAETGVPERVIRDWFDEKLITKLGVRGQVLWEPGESEGLPNRAIEALIDRHLVRRESRRGALFFELAHDRLIGPIRASNDAWFQVNLTALQRQAKLWNSQGRASGYLLTGEALEQAEQWAAEHEKTLSSLERAFLADSRERRALEEAERQEQELIAAQQLAAEAQARQQAEEAARHEAERRVVEQARSASRLRALAWATGIAAVLAVLAAGFFLYQRTEADRQRAVAVAAVSTAEAAVQIAEALTDVTRSGLLSAWSANALRDRDPITAIALSLEALRAADTADARRAILNAVATGPNATFGAGESIAGISFSPDGTSLATADTNGALTLWQLGSLPNSSRRVLAPDPLAGVAFAPDGARIATAGIGGVSLWDAATLDLLATPIASEATGVAFSPDGAEIVAGGADGSVTLIPVAGGDATSLAQAKSASRPVNAVAYSTAGWIAAGKDDGTILLWNPADRDTPVVLQGPRAVFGGGRTSDGAAIAITSLAFDPTGALLASGDSAGAVRLWDPAGAFQIGGPLERGTEPLTAVAFSPDGATVAASNQSGQIALWDVDNRRLLHVLARPGSSAASSLAFDPVGGILASGGTGSVSLWSLTAPPLAAGPYPLGIDEVNAVAFARAQNRLAVAGNTGILQLCAVANEVSCQTLMESERPITSLALSQTGDLLAFADIDGTVSILDTADTSEVHGFQTNGRVESLAFSPDAARLAAGIAPPSSPESYDPATGAILLWDLTTGEETRFDLDSPVVSLAFAPNGLHLVSGESGVVTWVATGGEEPEPRQHPAGESPIRAVAVSPNGALIAAAGDGVYAWTASTGEARMQETTESPAVALAFTPDGRTLATGHADGAILLWDFAAFTRFGSLGVLPASVASLSWTDAETLLAVDTTGSAFTFSTNPWSWVPAACQAMGEAPPAATSTPDSIQPTGSLCGPPVPVPSASPVPTP